MAFCHADSFGFEKSVSDVDVSVGNFILDVHNTEKFFKDTARSPS